MFASGPNWVGFVMLMLALVFNELYLGMNTWYDLNMSAVIGAVVYLVVGVTLAVWPSPNDERV
ncbi:MAG: hypothetical protein K2Q17_05440 [Nitrospiraceae bacterium]|jgi:hypothetical protein|uniref:hypothetical protein n=1 Tax=Nitrospira cf. moscoviensis SBR1015 TaxID=96242 RepID=UPI000A0C08B5|nr:hypothetical protein [Nitrospira cf. moscoviensis SBR1015]MBY0247093.1 hypothetical protein [Nitrospiraceae bacterium]OQW31092.1 MAG: hypothetical protein A4E20_15025 [Nitrospira sp. SG-bin2]